MKMERLEYKKWFNKFRTFLNDYFCLLPVFAIAFLFVYVSILAVIKMRSGTSVNIFVRPRGLGIVETYAMEKATTCIKKLKRLCKDKQQFQVSHSLFTDISFLPQECKDESNNVALVLKNTACKDGEMVSGEIFAIAKKAYGYYGYCGNKASWNCQVIQTAEKGMDIPTTVLFVPTTVTAPSREIVSILFSPDFADRCLKNIVSYCNQIQTEKKIDDVIPTLPGCKEVKILGETIKVLYAENVICKEGEVKIAEITIGAEAKNGDPTIWKVRAKVAYNPNGKNQLAWELQPF